MKHVMIGLLAATLMAGTANAATYADATGDLNDGSGGGSDLSGFTHLDIASVEVTNDATDISFTITFVGDILATNWGKYMIGIDSIAGGDTASNGWTRPISMSSGMDYWIGTWVDSGNGAETYSWNGVSGTWTLDNATYSPPSDIALPATTQFTETVTTSLSSLGLSPGDMFLFDVYSSGGGGGDSAIDALSSSTPSVMDWGGPFDSPGDAGLAKYTVTGVPEPAALALLGLGGTLAGYVLLRRR